MPASRPAKPYLWLFALLPTIVTFAAAQESAAVEPPAEPREAYLIGVNDLLEIFVWDEETQSRKVRVRPDGMITLPLVDDVEAAGKTPLELRDEIASRLEQFVKGPTVTVIVEQIDSRFVYVLGEVSNEGVMPLNQPLGLLEAIASRGGLSDFARGKVTVIRVWGGEEERFQLDLDPLLEGDADAENLALKPGDVLLVR